MKILMMKIMIVISSMLVFLKTPMSMGVMLLIQTFLSTIVMAKMMSTSWMPMIMFLMLVGGLLILFMYMSSIASNEKFSINMYFMMLMFILILPMEELLLNNMNLESQNSPIWSESITLSKIFNKKGMLITLTMFCYLLLTMIAVTAIIKIYKGPLRSK
uniref:NADH dehydrogenase subunit 6 n=1 Tax=Drabescoides nuchalis TaxID=1725375 RepID=A0A0U2L456_9HEMI|nr:NADH dehydrogenase subunit 6 [Drabescoides nuchalis]ALF99740.1 NADH dehydrogenase subunit 6 [Drabescoides nuchalis]